MIQLTDEIKINTKGLKSALKRLKFSEKKFYKSIAEYIWNGFDAQATTVEIICEFDDDYTFDENALLKSLTVKDNGYGINHEELNNKFKYIFDSEKMDARGNYKNISTFHGKNGVGRLTFFTFANKANWTTVYRNENDTYRYDIEISAENLELFSGMEKIPEKVDETTGTVINFSGINKSLIDKNLIEKELIDYLKREFCWFLELKKPKGYKLLINGQELDYTDILEDEEDFEIIHEKSGAKFDVRYIQWIYQMNDEYSKYYYLDENNEEKYKEHTTLNKQSDDFHHSIYITSKYFNDFIFKSTNRNGNSNKNIQIDLVGRSDEAFNYLLEKMQNYLRIKRRPFLKIHSDTIIKDLKKDGIISSPKTDFDRIQGEHLESVVRGLYVTQPKIFTTLNKEQKHVIIGFLKLLLDSDERERVIDIVEQMVKLDSAEREELSNLLKVTDLSRIIKTINLIKERYKILDVLKQILFNAELKADEIHHLQKVIENHTWIFGEKYSLVAAAEDNFDKALRNHIKILEDKDEDVVVDHPNKYRQVDIFICRQEKRQNTVHNVIIELKHPNKRLTPNNLFQVKRYMRTIMEIPRFNADNYTWDFILIGNKFDAAGHLEGELKSNKRKGEDGLVHEEDNHKIFVRKWSDILIDCDIRHTFLDEKLQINRKNLIDGELKSAEDALEMTKNSIAAY